MDSSDQRLGRSPPFFTGCVTRFCGGCLRLSRRDFLSASGQCRRDSLCLPPRLAGLAAARHGRADPTGCPQARCCSPRHQCRPQCRRLCGGIRRAGSNPRRRAAGHGWRSHHRLVPTSGRSPESWTIEVDLGRGVSARRVKLIFDPQGPAPSLFDLLLSTGEHAVDEGGQPHR